MALILRYFTEFGSFRDALRKSGRQSHNLWTIYDYYVCSKRLQSPGPRDAHGINTL